MMLHGSTSWDLSEIPTVTELVAVEQLTNTVKFVETDTDSD